MKKIFLYGVVVLSFCIVFSVSITNIIQAKNELGKKEVLVTTTIIKDLVESIAGDTVSVRSLMGPGVDPHTYQPTARDNTRILQADLIIFNGFHLEAKLSDILESLHNKSSVALSAIVPEHKKIFVSKEIVDPHFWFDTDIWKLAAFEVAEQLAVLVPEQKTVFFENAKAYAAQLDVQEAKISALMKAVDRKNRVLVSAHDAFGYFSKKYDWEVLPLQGVSTVTEASAFKVKKIVQEIIQKKIPAIFVETSVSPRKIKAIQDACHAKGWPVVIGGYLYTDALGADNSEANTYLKMIENNAMTITKAMTRHENLLSARSR